MRKRPVARARLSEEQLEGLVNKSRDGDTRAWEALWLELAPSLEKIAGNWRVTGPLSQSADERSNIVDRIMSALQKDRFRRLAELGTHLAQRDGSYQPWLWRVAVNLATDYVRAHPEYLGPSDGERPRWAKFVPLNDDLGDREDAHTVLLDRIEVHRILAYAQVTLAAPQLDALCQHMGGEAPEEIADALHVDGDRAAARLVRSATEKLRARFAEKRRRSTPPPPSQRLGRASVPPSPTSRRGTGGWATRRKKGGKGAKKKRGGSG